jgi:hypothetical protein
VKAAIRAFFRSNRDLHGRFSLHRVLNGPGKEYATAGLPAPKLALNFYAKRINAVDFPIFTSKSHGNS